MRVIAGEFKGRRLDAPKGDVSRPTLDRVREALFSILGRLDDLRVLDLYAGSGALGIEAMSRGAQHATFVDSDRAAVRVIERNLESLNLDRGSVFRTDATKFLQGAARHGDRWDLVFCDPPYRLADRLGPQLEALLEPVSGDGARIVIESSKKQPLRMALPVQLERAYGDTLVTVYSTKGEQNAS